MPTSKYRKGKNHEKNCSKTGSNGGKGGRYLSIPMIKKSAFDTPQTLS